MVKLEFPLRTHSTNALRAMHWAVRGKQVNMEKRVVWAEWQRAKVQKPELPCVVTLTRLGPKRLDSDNLSGSFKATRDKVAELIGIDDGDERIDWCYRQELSKEFRVRIEICSAPKVTRSGHSS